MRLGLPVTRESYLELILPEPDSDMDELDAEIEMSLPPFLRKG